MATTESDPEAEIDAEVAEQLARDRVADRLRPPVETEQSDVAQLVDHTAAIVRALDDGEPPERTDIGTARFYVKELEARLDEVTKLYGWNPWDTGVNWGELSEENKVEVKRRDKV